MYTRMYLTVRSLMQITGVISSLELISIFPIIFNIDEKTGSELKSFLSLHSVLSVNTVCEVARLKSVRLPVQSIWSIVRISSTFYCSMKFSRITDEPVSRHIFRPISLVFWRRNLNYLLDRRSNRCTPINRALLGKKERVYWRSGLKFWSDNLYLNL